MNPLFKVFIAVLLVATGLYVGVARFLGGTEELTQSLDLKSLAYIRPEPSDSREEKPVEVVAKDPVEPDPEAPARDEDASPDEQLTAGNEDEDAATPATDDGDDVVAKAQQAMLEKLGIRKPPPPVRAVDVALHIVEDCDASGVALAPVSVQYRHESPAIKGVSMKELAVLVAEFRRCGGGEFHFSSNVLAKTDTTPLLEQMRMDELKYYFIQHSVPRSALRFPDDQ